MTHTVTVETASPCGEFITRRKIPWRHDTKTGVVQVQSNVGWVPAGRTRKDPGRTAKNFCRRHHIETVALTGSTEQGVESLSLTYSSLEQD